MMTKDDATQSFDIAILGGGPAGALLARQLAGRGYGVLLHTLPQARPKHVEGLAPRAIERLRGAALPDLPLLTAAPLPRAAHWGGLMNRYNNEALVDRISFDAALLQQARAAGASIRARRITGPVSARDLGARILIEARGRQAPRHNVALRGPRTVALVQHYDQLPEGPGETILTAQPFGWIWAAFPGDGRATVQLMLDASAQPLNRARAAAIVRDNLGQCGEIAPRLQGARAVGPVLARDAGALLAGDLAAADYLRIGDAACAIDPLAGHGLYEAIAGAQAAAAVVATLLDRPADRDAAIAFHAARCRDVFLRHARMGRDFYRMESRWATEPFWRNRRHWPDDEPIHAPPLSAPPRIVQMPANIDGYIEQRPVIVTADHPRGILSISGVPLVPLMAMDKGLSVAELARQFKVTPEAIDSARHWLARYGLSAVPVP